jgi:hypothetical protein
MKDHKKSFDRRDTYRNIDNQVSSDPPLLFPKHCKASCRWGKRWNESFENHPRPNRAASSQFQAPNFPNYAYRNSLSSLANFINDMVSRKWQRESKRKSQLSHEWYGSWLALKISGWL